jgi:hypothetical protein
MERIRPHVKVGSSHVQRCLAATLVSRAQHSTSEAKWCAADPGPFQTVAVPDQRCITSLTLALHRIRDTSLGRVRSLIHFSNSPSRSRGAFLRPGFVTLLRSPESRGGRSAEKRSGACEAPVGRIMTRYARRLRGALRPMTRDARLSALHRGDFGLPGPRFSHRHLRRIGYSELLAPRS